jgi:hypothetical protein
MALLAQKGWSDRQQVFVVGAVGGMAIDTIILHGFMFIHKWTTFFRMANETCFVHRLFHQHRRAIGTMGIVAVSTGHRAFSHWMPVWFVNFQFLL